MRIQRYFCSFVHLFFKNVYIIFEKRKIVKNESLPQLDRF